MLERDKIKDWLKKSGIGGGFIKINAGETFQGFFEGMEFTETGGYGGKPTVKYKLREAGSTAVGTFSSSSKVFASKMMKIREGDEIVIKAGTSPKGTKMLDVKVVRSASELKKLTEQLDTGTEPDDTEVQEDDDLFSDDE